MTGPDEKLDRELPPTIADFASAYLLSTNTLERAKAEMDAAAKSAQDEARSKIKAPAERESPKSEAGAQEVPKPTQPVKAGYLKTAGLSDKIVSALFLDVAPSEAAVAQVRMIIDAKSTILKNGDFIPEPNERVIYIFALFADKWVAEIGRASCRERVFRRV